MKVALITGSAKGLGAEIAKFFAMENYTVVVHYRRSASDAQKVLIEIKKDSPDSIALKGDLLNEKDVVKLISEVVKRFGRIDLLVNNVGNFLYKDFGKTTNEEFRDMVESNIYPALYCSRAVLEQMRKQKSGQIINIGAVGADRIVIRVKSTPYFIGKTGLFILSKIMAWEEAKNGIRINMVSPASLVEDIFKAGDFPMGRSAKPSDVISALKFLISNENSYINGANIEVAGATVPGIEK